jgi:hypothetical protein
MFWSPRRSAPSVKQLPSGLVLRVVRIPDLEPALAVDTALQFRDDALQVPLAHEVEQIAAAPVVIASEQDLS